MSKNALRYPETAIAGGLFGTARVRGAAPITVMPAPLTPVQRTQALGRLGTGCRNNTEAAYEAVLELERRVGLIEWYRFEGIKLRLADNTFYTPDFAVIAGGQLQFREVKGRWTDDARVKIKVAAQQYPWAFFAIHKDGACWRVEDLTCKHG